MIKRDLLLKLGFKQDTWSNPYPRWYNIFDTVNDPPCTDVYTYTAGNPMAQKDPIVLRCSCPPRGPFGVFESNDAWGRGNYTI